MEQGDKDFKVAFGVMLTFRRRVLDPHGHKGGRLGEDPP